MNEKGSSSRTASGLRIVLMALALFAAANIAFAALNPMPQIARLSAYNTLAPGRARLPFGNDIGQSCNLIVNNLDAMFASHEIAAGAKPVDEYRVALIGDSSVWGVLLKPEETLAAQLNALGMSKAGKNVRVYNLGYPDFSLAKDTLILHRALGYQPDLIVWLVTLNSLPNARQMDHALAQANAAELKPLLPAQSITPTAQTFWDGTIVGQRRNLADMARLQLCAPRWAATRQDQVIRPDYERWSVDLEADPGFGALQPPVLADVALAFDVLDAGAKLARSKGASLLIVNEPMAQSNGKNSDIRYNAFYPRWAYDQYRKRMADNAKKSGWNYLDLWNVIPPNEFTNSPVHLSPAGSRALAEKLGEEIRK